MMSDRYALRVAVFYGALFLIYGIQVPYLPVWLHWRGLDPNEIAIVTAAPFFLRLIVTPTVALLADRHDWHRPLVIVLSAVSLILAVFLGQATGFGPILAAALPLAIAVSTMMPLTETIAMRGVRAHGLDYGRMRLWGSLTFIAAGIAGGAALDRFGAGVASWLLLLGAIATAAAAHSLPRTDAVGAGGDPAPRTVTKADILALVRSRELLLFLLAAGSVQGAHGTFYTFGALHWSKLGLSSATTGALWAIAVLAEVGVFAWSRALAERFGPLNLLLAGAAGAAVRWTAMAFDPPFALLVPLQAMHALSYGASHLGAMHFIASRIPSHAAGTAQALYATMAAGVFLGATTLASGPLYARFAGGVYFAPAAMAVIGLLALIALARQGAK